MRYFNTSNSFLHTFLLAIWVDYPCQIPGRSALWIAVQMSFTVFTPTTTWVNKAHWARFLPLAGGLTVTNMGCSWWWAGTKGSDMPADDALLSHQGNVVCPTLGITLSAALMLTLWYHLMSHMSCHKSMISIWVGCLLQRQWSGHLVLMLQD